MEGAISKRRRFLGASRRDECVCEARDSSDQALGACIVSIPWLEQHSIGGYFVPFESATSADVPVVLCVGEARHGKQQLLAALRRPARDCGMALLCIDLPGPVRSSDAEPCAGPETAIVAAIDYLHDTAGINPARIAVVADGSPSSLVARGIALDGRVAAAVCDGGVWQLWEDELIEAGCRESIEPVTLLRGVRCPTMMLIGPQDRIDAAHVRQLLSHSGRREFHVREMEASVGEQGGSLDSAARVVFRWLSEQLKREKSA